MRFRIRNHGAGGSLSSAESNEPLGCDSFKYNTLDPDHDQIRLLKLSHQSGTTKTIECTLTTHPRKSCPPYQALSYVWGNYAPKKDKTITVNRCSFKIRANLFDFLAMASQTRELSEETFLWIDQICINQENLVEKSQQVKLMAKTYESAQQVVVWLGEPRSRSCGQALPTLVEHSNEDVWDLSKQKWRRCKRAWRSIANLPYWKRLWVYQEFSTCVPLVLYHGKRSISWEQLSPYRKLPLYEDFLEANVLQFILRCFFNTFYGCLVGVGSFHMNRLISIRKAQLEDHAASTISQRAWVDALEMTRGTKCKCKHDIAYAMLRFVDPAYQFEPNYSLSLEELFWTLVQFEQAEDGETMWVRAAMCFTVRRRMGLKSTISYGDISKYLQRHWGELSDSKDRGFDSPSNEANRALHSRRKLRVKRSILGGYLLSWFLDKLAKTQTSLVPTQYDQVNNDDQSELSNDSEHLATSRRVLDV